MAFFSFGKKDKNPPEVAEPVAKTQPTAPRIQAPPGTGSFPAVKPPQPTGLMPAVVPAGVATTQPISMPRSATSGLKPSKPGLGQSTRSTQRIVLPTPPGARTSATKALSTGVGTPSGRINLPIGMILRCLPPEVLADELSKFEANGMAATEIGLPMNIILGQLPSGKVEMTLQDIIPHFPAGYLQPTESIASYLPTVVSLPLMDVVMRIPPDLLALRPDQKDVDSAVINMADPFTEEILREQAEAARRQSQPNIIEESQAPQEEFVPRDQAAAASKSIAPPRRPTVDPLTPSRAPTAFAPAPTPPAARIATPPAMSNPRGISVPPPPIPVPAPRNPTATGSMPAPTRSTTVMPPRPQAPISIHSDTIPLSQATAGSAGLSAAPVPPVPRRTGAIPAPPPPRHTTSLPVPTRTASVAVPMLSSTSTLAAPAPASPAPVDPDPVPEEPAAPTGGTDDLQRLAALAMAQLGDEKAESPAEASLPEATPVDVAPEAEPVAPSVPEADVAEPTPEPVLAAPPEPAIAPAIAPITVPLPEPELPVEPQAVAEPIPEPAPKTIAPASSFSFSAPPAPEPEVHEEAAPSSGVAFNLNTCTAEELVKNIPGCSQELGLAIVEHRTKIGSFKRLEDLLDVPGITKAAYTNLTGEAPPDNRIPLSLNELLGFAVEQHISLKDVTDRIACWPDVTGCVLSQSSGLSLVGTVPSGVDKNAVVAFAPKMFEAINKSFLEVSGVETDALVIPTAGTSFHLFRNRDLYLIIMSRLPQMPERHVKVARFVLAALSVRKA